MRLPWLNALLESSYRKKSSRQYQPLRRPSRANTSAEVDGVRDGNRLPGAVEHFQAHCRPLAAYPSLSFVARGLHDTSSLSIMKCDVDIEDDLYASVALLHHVPRDRRAHDQDVDRVGTIHGVRGGGSTRAKVFR